MYFVYIMSNKTRTVLYIGMANNLECRVAEHKTHTNAGFTAQYNVTSILYFEQFETPRDAIVREKQLKNWLRIKKKVLIDKVNPTWRDLSAAWV